MSQSTQPSVEVGSGDFRFAVEQTWEKLPAGFAWREVAAVATDSENRVFVFNRGDHPVVVLAPNGSFLASWGQGQFVRPHGITIGPDNCVYLTDDSDHTVRKYTAHGNLLMTLGTSGRPSDTGATSVDFRTIQRAGPPFHYPTNVALSTNGDIYISDGYGNSRIHQFSADGKLICSWGEPGSKPGEFQIPHGIAMSRDGIIYVADRENSRIQLFTSSGKFLDQWTDVARPCQVALDSEGNVYVAELGFRAGMWPGTKAPSPESTGGRVSIFDASGRLLVRWGGGRTPTAPGDFFAPHDICIDNSGNVYVAEVVLSAGGNRGLVSPDCHTLQKFVRTGSIV
jgi:DNA-binding beta-propeller fold protein YncE